MITERYRKDYTGEFIITNTSWAGGKKRTQREWMPNPIENRSEEHTSELQSH